MSDLISRQAAIDAFEDTTFTKNEILRRLSELPSAQPEQKWNHLMMYLADLQLTYSPNWGANGHGDEKLYEFVTKLIEELEGWDDQNENHQTTSV